MTNLFIFITSGIALLLGALVGIYLSVSQKMIARLMAFGSGVLICALAITLMEESFAKGGLLSATVGFTAGGLVFVLGDYLIHIKGGRRHRRKPLKVVVDSSSGTSIAMGALFDGIPESIALGIAVATGQTAGVLLGSAIFLSNFPEGISSIPGLKKEKFSQSQIVGLWSLVSVFVIVAAFLSYRFLGDLSPNVLAIIEAFAAGSILAMISDTMMPEAYEEGGFTIAIMTVCGFMLAFILARLG